VKAFNHLADFSTEEIAALLELANRLVKRPQSEARNRMPAQRAVLHRMMRVAS
jgi:hypothetical protein